MARTKPTPQIITRTQVENHLMRYGILQNSAETLRADADNAIKRIKEELASSLAPIELEMDQISDEITHHLRIFKADFIVNRTIKFRFGNIGWRKIRSDALSISNKAREAIIETLEHLGMSDCIRVEKKIDARKLSEYPDTVLEKIDGVSRPAESDEPWFEAVREPIDPDQRN